MTDRPDSPDDVAEVRRLLAEARYTEPMPDDVVARLDDVLSGLAAEAPQSAEVVPLEARRRRRAAAGLLVAAAAVVVGGVAVAPHLRSSGSSSQTAGTDSAVRGSDDAAGNTGEGQTPGPTRNSTTATSPKAPRIDAGAVVVRPRHFSADARAVQQQLDSVAESFSAAHRPQCAVAPAGADSVAAEYLNAPAALVFKRAQGSSQVVELYLCGQAAPVRTATLPVP